MKNIIAISSLLAAGTMLANAAVVDTELLWGLDFSKGTSLDSAKHGSGAFSNLSGSGTIDQNDGFISGAGSYSTSSKNKLSFTSENSSVGSQTDALKEGSGSFTISFHAKYDSDFSTSEWPVLFAFGVNSSYQWKLTDYKNQNKIVMDKDGYQEMTGAGTDGKTLASQSASSEWAHYALVLEGSSGARTLSLYIDGEKKGTGTVNLTSQNAMTNFAFGGKLSAGKESSLTLSDIAIYKGALGQEQISYLKTHKANASAIPEPSAFGLLAGAGALALVAARRRRRR